MKHLFFLLFFIVLFACDGFFEPHAEAQSSYVFTVQENYSEMQFQNFDSYANSTKYTNFDGTLLGSYHNVEYHGGPTFMSVQFKDTLSQNWIIGNLILEAEDSLFLRISHRINGSNQDLIEYNLGGLEDIQGEHTFRITKAEGTFSFYVDDTLKKTMTPAFSNVPDKLHELHFYFTDVIDENFYLAGDFKPTSYADSGGVNLEVGGYLHEFVIDNDYFDDILLTDAQQADYLFFLWDGTVYPSSEVNYRPYNKFKNYIRWGGYK